MATTLPAKFKNSSFVTGLAKQKDAAVARARKANQSNGSAPRRVGTTMGGAFVGGLASAFIPGIGPVPTPALLALALWAAGAASGSSDLVNAGTGNAALLAGALGEAMASQVAGQAS